uniref:peptidylprolyl isomerase n=1 Tax=Eutreptiella gymnastica TaxID=73025 RepID=A0A7S1J1X4_9EUGL
MLDEPQPFEGPAAASQPTAAQGTAATAAVPEELPTPQGLASVDGGANPLQPVASDASGEAEAPVWEAREGDELLLDVPEFIASDHYDGSRPGMVFKKGDQGLGYYKDLGVPGLPLDVQTKLMQATKVEGFEDVPGTHGGVMKKMVREGRNPNLRPEPGGLVVVHYTGWVHAMLGDTQVHRLERIDATRFDSSREKGRHVLQFKVGLGRALKAWEAAIPEMRVGEEGILRCRSDCAFGTAGRGGRVPPGAVVDFQIELCECYPVDPGPRGTPPAAQIAAAEQHRQRGNLRFKSNDWHAAYDAYLHGRTFLKPMLDGEEDEDCGTETQEEFEAAKKLAVILDLNAAQAALKAKEPLRTVFHCTSALELDPTNVKGLYRRAMGHMETLAVEEAQADLEQAHYLDPDNETVAAALRKLPRTALSAAKAEKEQFWRMLKAQHIIQS